MQTAEFDHTVFTPSGQSEADKQLLVKFYLQPIVDKEASAEQGRPIYKEVEFISIKAPGSRDGFEGRARERDRQRFPLHYDAFKQRVEMPIEGTPLSEWAGIPRSSVEELAYINVKTVEQLAAIPDSTIQQGRGVGSLKQKAADWLAMSKEGATLQEMNKQLAARDKMLDKLQAQIDELQAKLDGE